MQTVDLVSHPRYLKMYGLTPIGVNTYQNNAGPLGFCHYSIETENPNNLLNISASPWYIEMDKQVMEAYCSEYFIKMLQLFLEVRIGMKPDSFQVIKFEDTQTICYYPLFRSQYLYIGVEERILLQVDPLALLGFVPVSADPLVWEHAKVVDPVIFEGACVVKTPSLMIPQWERIQSTQQEIDYAKIKQEVVILPQEQLCGL